MIKKILFLLVFISTFVHAGLPPNSSKASGDTSFVTTFKTDYGSWPVTRSGTTLTLGTLPISMGGTGSATRNYVLLAGDTMTGTLLVENTIGITKGVSSGPNNLFYGPNYNTTLTTGFANTGIGDTAAAHVTGGASVTAVGFEALGYATTGDASTAVGAQAGRAQFAGGANNYFGVSSGYSNQNGQYNSGFGNGTLYINNGHSRNSAFGYQSCVQVNGDGNVCLGHEAGYNQTGATSNKLWIANIDTGIGSNLITGDFSTGQVGINIDPTSLNTSAAFQIASTTGSFVPPVMTTTQQNAISTPLEGSEIHNSTTHKHSIYDGTAWRQYVDNASNETIAGTKTFSSTISGSINGNAATVTTNANLSGEATSSGSNAVTLTNSAVIGKVLTGYTSGAGTVSATDTILGAIQKLNGNVSAIVSFSNLTGDVTSVGAATTIGAGKVTNSMLAGSIDLTTKVTGALPIANGGTGQTTKAPAFDALQPMTTGGDIIYGGASGTGTRLANGSAGQFLKSNGTTLAPTWASAGNNASTVAKTGNYTLTSADQVVFWDTSSASGNATLLTAVGNTGLQLTIALNATGNTLTINTTSSQTVGGFASGAITMNRQGDRLSVVSNGTNWSILEMTSGMAITPGVSTNIDAFAVSYGTTNLTTACSGTPCFIDQIGNAVSSITWQSGGNYTLNLNKTYIKLKCSASGTSRIISAIQCANCNSVAFESENTTTAANSFATMTCVGSY